MSISAVEAPSRKSETRQKEQTDQPWNIVVFDDPVNLMEYVTRVIVKIFGYSKAQAEEMMMQVHQQGKSVVWSGGREKAEMYVQQLHTAQLHASLEKSS
ncbi:MAG: ATP-dependent Clp protease adapter ClpS [Akkermansiaceae bacterium]|nr:ATP-dependent Clp protease adapter ClpS [Akkermansiaceae bacterium]